MKNKMPAQQQPSTTLGPWVWLFPLTYVFHLGEEYWGGEGFAAWISQVAGAHFSEHDFLTLNAIGLAFMTLGVWLIRQNSWRWLLIGLSGIVLLNGILHLLGSLITHSYSPGLFSGVLCWVPLGAITLIRQWQLASRKSFFIGVGIAVGLHGIVSLLALLA